MSFKSAKDSLEKDLNAIKEGSLWKTERAVSYTHLTLPTNREV